MQLAVSSDMLVEGRHFLSTVAPERWATRRWRST
jgi:thiamine monophosphate kinase